MNERLAAENTSLLRELARAHAYALPPHAPCGTGSAAVPLRRWPGAAARDVESTGGSSMHSVLGGGRWQALLRESLSIAEALEVVACAPSDIEATGPQGPAEAHATADAGSCGAGESGLQLLQPVDEGLVGEEQTLTTGGSIAVGVSVFEEAAAAIAAMHSVVRKLQADLARAVASGLLLTLQHHAYMWRIRACPCGALWETLAWQMRPRALQHQHLLTARGCPACGSEPRSRSRSSELWCRCCSGQLKALAR